MAMWSLSSVLIFSVDRFVDFQNYLVCFTQVFLQRFPKSCFTESYLLDFQIYHGFYHIQTMVYDRFRLYYICLESILESFQVQVCLVAMFRLWSILELKIEETCRCSKTSQSRYSYRMSIDIDPLVSLDTDARRRATSSWPT